MPYWSEHHEAQKRETAYMLEEAQMLIDTGANPETIPTRIGTTHATLARQARRYGHPALARHFEPHAKRALRARHARVR
jgi:hypothetical protein